MADGAERAKSSAKKGDAERHLRGFVARVETGTYADPVRSAVTFGAVAEAWMNTKEANRAPKTVAGYRELVDVVIVPKWRDERLRDIDHEGLQTRVTWLATELAARRRAKHDEDEEIAQTGLPAARVIQTYQVVRQVLAYAVRAKYLAVSSCEHIELPRKPQSEELALTHDHVSKLADECGVMRVMVLFLAYTGLRFGSASLCESVMSTPSVVE